VSGCLNSSRFRFDPNDDGEIYYRTSRYCDVTYFSVHTKCDNDHGTSSICAMRKRGMIPGMKITCIMIKVWFTGIPKSHLGFLSYHVPKGLTYVVTQRFARKLFTCVWEPSRMSRCHCLLLIQREFWSHVHVLPNLLGHTIESYIYGMWLWEIVQYSSEIF
jgi:hypothetical protein